MDDYDHAVDEGYQDLAFKQYEESGANALVFEGLGTERFCSFCERPGVFGTTLQPLGSGRWTCAACIPLAA